MTKVLVERAVVEGALEAFKQIDSHYWHDFVQPHIAQLSAALEQPPLEATVYRVSPKLEARINKALNLPPMPPSTKGP